MKEMYILEYPMNSSIRILFPRLSTSTGLSEWFADEVTEAGSIFTFRWKTHTQQAKMIKLKDLQSVRFQWLEEESSDEDNYFEFKVSQDELTGEVLLTIIDFADPDDIDDSKGLWETQVNDLKRLLGS